MNHLAYFEIPSTDLNSSLVFYNQVFGWQLDQTAEDYLVIRFQEGIEGGVYHVSDIQPSQTRLYIRVANINEILKKAVDSGGTVAEDEHSIGKHGFTAAFRDPNGFRLDIWSPTGNVSD